MHWENAKLNINRRATIRTSIGLALSGVFGAHMSRAVGAPEDAANLVAEFAGDASPIEGTIKLTAPEIAENGNTVPIAVAVESPMTEDEYVESIMVVAEGNPRPEVITFNFTPQSGIARASTRMRLAQTQNVVAVAKMNDGSVFTDSRNVKVTIGGCGG